MNRSYLCINKRGSLNAHHKYLKYLLKILKFLESGLKSFSKRSTCETKQTIRKGTIQHNNDCILNIYQVLWFFFYLRKSESSYIPPSGIPWAFCLLALRTSFAETKKMRFLASTGSITLSSSTRKVRQRSMCCLRTWGKGKKLMRKRQKLSHCQINISELCYHYKTKRQYKEDFFFFFF